MSVDVWVMRLRRAGAREARAAILSARPGCSSSFSDCGDVALLAVAPGGPLGVDVERIRERAAIERVARRVLDAAECEAIDAANGAQRLERFYRSWTAAEACAKAVGEGLPALLSDRPRPVLPVRWLEPFPGYVAAVATAEPNSLVRVREWR